MLRRLQPCLPVPEAATLCTGGCNPVCRRLQPYGLEAPPLYTCIYVPQAELEVGQLGTLCVLLTSEAVHWARASTTCG